MMDDQQQRLDHLLAKLNILVSKQELVSREINELRSEVEKLKTGKPEESTSDVHAGKEPEAIEAGSQKIPEVTVEPAEEIPQVVDTAPTKRKRGFSIRTDVEKFIGENLINKIGIAITIIGVGIGVKYSVEHDLITPLMRVISGYIVGLVLLLIGIRLKAKYEQYSAVLVSGAMAILYFITFAAYGFYDLIPVWLAFGLMVLFTVFMVIAAIQYNQQVIALIGMVGAYAVPFLLSDDTGEVWILLSFISIINVGILFIAFRRYWKILYYSAFLLSWIIFAFWYVNDYNIDDHFSLALVFSAIFFLTFYATFLAYKLLKKEIFSVEDILLLIINSFVFYGFGYWTLQEHESGKELLGLFTACNAVIHFFVSVIVYRQKLADRNLFYLVIGLVFAFITIAIPVQLDGNWVTLLWIAEATLLFRIGQLKDAKMYEKMSYPLIVLATLSLIHDFDHIYVRYISNNPDSLITPFLNVHFLSSMLFVAGMAVIVQMQKSKSYTPPKLSPPMMQIVHYSIPGIFLLMLFLAIRYEIGNYWDQLYFPTSVEVGGGAVQGASIIYNENIPLFRSIWLINYAMIFVIGLSLVNIFKLKNSELAIWNLVLNAVMLYIFLLQGLYALSDLRENFLSQAQSEYFEVGRYNIVIRYISLLIAAALLAVSHQYVRQEFIKQSLQQITGIVSHLAVLWILSSELLHWLDFAGVKESYKLGLSILWGSYSLMLIIIGIWKKKKYLRIMAIAIFAVTLIKLFVYDVSHLKTLSKLVLFMSLGILLLIISFLYNKYKHLIADDE